MAEQIATQRKTEHRYRWPHKRIDRSKIAVGDVGETVMTTDVDTVLKTASTAEFVTLFATATTSPQNQ